MRNTSITCPVSVNRVNESVARVAAFLTIAITVIGMCCKSPYIIGALAIDFYLRAFTSGRYSPLKGISKVLALYIGLHGKSSDAAPKKFAAGIGFIFTVAIAVLLLLNYTLLAGLVSGILVVCAGLESFAGFCLGCVIYTYAVLPFVKIEDSEDPIIINL